MTNARLEADLGQTEAWDRYYSAQAEVEALRELSRELVEQFGGIDHLPNNDPNSWSARLRLAASDIPIANRKG